MSAELVTGIMGRLREATWPQHRHAETRPLERELAAGRLPREVFIAWLGQRLRMHEALERAVTRLAAADRRVGGIVRDELLQADRLRRDLAFFGCDPEQVVCGAAARLFIDETDAIAAQDPIVLLGSYYVFEGSKNGAKFIARAVSRAYGLSNGPGMLYLDPHGEQQRPLWARFKEDMDAADFSEAEQEGMVARAQRTFELVSAADDELYRGAAVPA